MCGHTHDVEDLHEMLGTKKQVAYYTIDYEWLEQSHTMAGRKAGNYNL